MAKAQDQEFEGRHVNKGRDRIITRSLVAKGEPYIDIRTYYEDDSGEWLPTKKGIRLHCEMVPTLLEQIQQSLDDVDEVLAVGVKH